MTQLHSVMSYDVLVLLFKPSIPFNSFPTGNKAVVCALSASYISTFAGYPVRIQFHGFGLKFRFHRPEQLDSLKSRLQTTKTSISIPKLAALVYREEGIKGFYRGLWIPLMTISFVRACSSILFSNVPLGSSSSFFRCCKLHHLFPHQRALCYS